MRIAVGDDTFDGSEGEDTLEIYGSGAAELMMINSLGKNGFVFFRDVGDITVNLLFAERVEANGLAATTSSTVRRKLIPRSPSTSRVVQAMTAQRAALNLIPSSSVPTLPTGWSRGCVANL
ncbi:hypothetical protein [Microvirga arabica]|uniref:Haemolysin-type calcium binding-related domain-containing protein n=2 Tax=Microvirga arabica TaxID=1128671 RepID=A0ABV6Y926_9HYPH|nr:hypothetical protein [Microvirga arabica]